MTQLNLANYQPSQPIVEAWGDVVDVRQEQADEWREMGWGAFGGVQSTGRPDDRLGGKLRPIYETEQDLDELRAISRIIADSTVPGIAALTNLTNYVIGKGFVYKAMPAKGVTDKALSDEVQSVIDDFLERDRWCIYRERELFRSSRRDGEYLLWLKNEGGFTTSRIVDVARIRQPEQLPPVGVSWSFGVETDADNLEDVAGYHVQWDDFTAQLDYLDSSAVFHLKLNVDSGVKRGVSDFFALNPDLPSIRKLLRNMVKGGSVQAAIAYIVEHAQGVTQSQVEAMRSGSATLKYDKTYPTGTKQRYVVEDRPGTRIDVAKGQVYKGSPLASGEAGRAFVEILSAGLRSIGSRWCMPEYMISGDASNANYASTKEAGTPFVKNCEAEQAIYCDQYRRVMWKVVENACRAGVIRRPFAEVRRAIEIQVESPAIAIRDPDKETARRQILRQEGILSAITWASQENLDYDQEVRNGAKKMEPAQPAMGPAESAVSAALESVRATDEALAVLESLYP